MSDGQSVYRLGSDPEMHIVNEKGLGIAPYGYTPSEVDGTAIEPRVNAAWCREEVRGYLLSIINNARNRTSPNGHSVSFQPVVMLDPEIIEGLTPEQREFGCAPEWNVYEQKEVSCSIPSPDYPERYLGGHIHVSMNREVPRDTRAEMVRMMDYWVGLVATALTSHDDQEKEQKRRQFYGKAGSFRFTNYGEFGHYNNYQQILGLEYRMLSTAQFLGNPASASLMLGLVKGIAEFPRKTIDTQLKILDAAIGQETVQRVINEVDIDMARDCVKSVLIQKQEGMCLTPYDDSPISGGNRGIRNSIAAFVSAAERNTWYGSSDPEILDNWYNDVGHRTLVTNLSNRNPVNWNWVVRNGSNMSQTKTELFENMRRNAREGMIEMGVLRA